MVIIIVALLILIALTWVVISNLNKEIISPLGMMREIVKKREYKVVAFLPNWSVNKYEKFPKNIDEIIFWDEGSVKAASKFRGEKIVGVVQIVNSEKIDYQAELAKIKAKNVLDGVNIDFEFNDNPLGVLSEEYFDFLKRVREEGVKKISVDVFVNTIIKGDKESLNKLFEAVDEVIIMAYDFHRPGMDVAGPVAPIRTPIGERSIWECVQRINDLGLPRDKIIMAYPLYGYEWKVYSDDYRAQIKRGWYQVASLKRVKELIKEKGLIERWDEEAASPWLSFEENGQLRHIYYDNEKSLKIKIDLVKQNQFKGVAFWALGYENSPNLFTLLTND